MFIQNTKLIQPVILLWQISGQIKDAQLLKIIIITIEQQMSEIFLQKIKNKYETKILSN